MLHKYVSRIVVAYLLHHQSNSVIARGNDLQVSLKQQPRDLFRRFTGTLTKVHCQTSMEGRQSDSFISKGFVTSADELFVLRYI
jgi:hypothetical protein